MKILNIGSGPVSMTGFIPGIDFTHADRRDYGTPVKRQNMEHLTYPDDEFDLVVCINALDHTVDAISAVEEMIRVGKSVYIDCALIQRTTSGKNHYWDMTEKGILVNKDEGMFSLEALGFEIEFIDNGGERRYNHIIARKQC